ncbi:DUF4465 domain-containing protein [Symmachiella dynata]|uniref:DUF4465 domain-containing protein n=1 Tax=Symmachiella dynata TaxID=2527995 RepID=UPI0018D465C2|nr:DUF4465 domain-containing protein [Symmachiella dynata]
MLLALWLAQTFASSGQAALIVDFEDIPLSSESHFNGPDPTGYDVISQYGSTVRVGSIVSGGVSFVNRYDLDFGSWSNFAVSNESDTTSPGFTNQFSAYPGTGAGTGQDNYGVGFGFDDLEPNLFDPTPFNALDANHLLGLPTLFLPDGYEIAGAMFTNTTYTALSMLLGDSFAKKFGGISGNDPDYFKLSVFGIDANGQALGTEVELYLADYRFADNSLDYILSDWSYLDLTGLAAARSLHFNVSSSDSGNYGMNTPGYFAIDNLMLDPAAPSVVPEPGTFTLLALGGLLSGGFYLRRSARSRTAKSAAK